jgi:micrococcal nuclease
MKYLYHYKAEVLSVYDGDTVTLMIDQGMKHFARVKVRMIGIDTPEIRTKDLEEKKRGYDAKDYLKSRIEGKTIIVQTQKKGKFGRWLGVLWEYSEDSEELGESLNDEMIRMGHAKAYDGGKR